MYILDTSIDSTGECSIIKGSCDIINSTDIIFNTTKEIKLYPNPFLNNINIEIELSQSSDLRIFVYNISGQKEFELYNLKCNTGLNKIKLDLKNLSSGFHILVLQFDSTIIPFKILKYE